MKKSLLSALVLVSASLSAQAGQFYIGAGTAGLIGSGEEEWSMGSNSMSYDYDYSETSLSFGYKFNNNQRLQVSYNSIDIDYDAGFDNSTYSGFDFDYYFAFGSSDWKPFLMAGLGSYVYEDTAEYYVDDEDLSGLSLNLGAGVIWQPIKHVDLELAYKYRSIQWQDQITFGGTTIETDSSHHGLALAAHFLF
ncbi:outer membrane beta-barrel protein [Oceanobacter mangrovi]|uniref:outer membrane beta-barrel protein n=1 Tax=Oceanobacter mangrovi TaxID=2862510 RepID=UPI001C8D61D8|nr:outer membrane beta-barrel protein [Oceanobacter mangrovi]